MYYTYVLITPTTLVCLHFSTTIPTSLFIKQLFFILVANIQNVHVHVHVHVHVYVYAVVYMNVYVHV